MSPFRYRDEESSTGTIVGVLVVMYIFQNGGFSLSLITLKQLRQQ